MAIVSRGNPKLIVPGREAVEISNCMFEYRMQPMSRELLPDGRPAQWYLGATPEILATMSVDFNGRPPVQFGDRINISMPEGGEYGFTLRSIQVHSNPDGTFRVEYEGVLGERQLALPDRMRRIMASRQARAFHQRRQPLQLPADVREQRARETLRQVVGQGKYLDFLRRGFVSVQSKSGLVYQIFPGAGMTKVFDQGQLVERLCVVLNGDFAPTDSVIMRYLLILNDETFFRAKAIRHSVDGYTRQQAAPKTDERTLVDIFKELKLAA